MVERISSTSSAGASNHRRHDIAVVEHGLGAVRPAALCVVLPVSAQRNGDGPTEGCGITVQPDDAADLLVREPHEHTLGAHRVPYDDLGATAAR